MMQLQVRQHWIATAQGRLFAQDWTPEAEQGVPIILLHDSLGCVALWREFPGRLARATDGSHGIVWDEAQILRYFPRLKERMNVAADYLSGGEQQMLAVARALSGNVRLLLLDEPFEGLAPTVVQELFTVFDQLREHMSIVIVEHNLDLVLALADRVFALERGAVFHTGPAEPLLNDLDYRKKILWL